MQPWSLGARDIAQRIADRDVSATEVIDAHLDRIADVNPRLNAVVRVLEEEARAAARLADRAVRAGEALGRLHGVPFTVKENIDLAGSPTTDGIPALAQAIAPLDAPIVERLRGAGAIAIGRTNLPDLALRMQTDSSLHGLTRNPWHPDRTAGGSSGGDAVALATGMTPLGTGNDIGGSLRAPAHCCGIAAIKPTFGRVAHARSVAPQDGSLAGQLMAVPGVMARNVADLRLALSVVAGPHRRDPDALPMPLVEDDAAGCRVAMVAEPPGGETHPGIAEAVRRAGRALSDAGYEVVETVPPHFERALELWSGWLATELRVRMPVLEEVMGKDGFNFLAFVLESLPSLELATYVAALTDRRTVACSWQAFLTEHPLVLSPVWTQLPFEHGFDVADADGAMAVLNLVRPVLPANLLGLPAAVVPAGLADGLPAGVQILGARFSEMRCLAAAESIEAALGTLTPVDPTREQGGAQHAAR